MLAGISADYYLRLEQGRDRNPSVQVLEALAGVLQLDATATDYLLGLGADPAAPRAGRRARDGAARRSRQLLDRDRAAGVRRGPLPRRARRQPARHRAVAQRPGRARTGCARSSSTRRSATLHPDWERRCRGWSPASASRIGNNIDDPRVVAAGRRAVARQRGVPPAWARHDVKPHPEPVDPDGAPAGRRARAGAVESWPIEGTDGQMLVIYHAEPGTEAADKLALLATLVVGETPVGGLKCSAMRSLGLLLRPFLVAGLALLLVPIAAPPAQAASGTITGIAVDSDGKPLENVYWELYTLEATSGRRCSSGRSSPTAPGASPGRWRSAASTASASLTPTTASPTRRRPTGSPRSATGTGAGPTPTPGRPRRPGPRPPQRRPRHSRSRCRSRGSGWRRSIPSSSAPTRSGIPSRSSVRRDGGPPTPRSATSGCHRAATRPPPRSPAPPRRPSSRRRHSPASGSTPSSPPASPATSPPGSARRSPRSARPTCS